MEKKVSLFLLVALAIAVVLPVQVQSARAVPAITYRDTAFRKDVRALVESWLTTNPGFGPGLIRLAFHDCFVNGCDASVLLLSTPINGSDGRTERAAGSNTGLRGFPVIQDIRDKFGPGQGVTCADAIVYAAHEAINILSKGTIAYDNLLAGPGRPDSIRSSSDDPGRFLPGPRSSFAQLEAAFKVKKFIPQEIVALSGAHAIGVSQATSFNPPASGQMDPNYQAALAGEVAANAMAVRNNIRDMSNKTIADSLYKPNNVNMLAVGVLDNSFYNAVLQKMVLFGSDAALKDPSVVSNVMQYMNNATKWNEDFGFAMAKLSKLAAPKGAASASRRDCSAIN